MADIAWIDSVHHDSSAFYVTIKGTRIGDKGTVRLRAGLDAPIERLFVRTTPDGEQAMTPMRRVDVDAICQWWEAEMLLLMPLTHYRFLLVTSDGGWWLTAEGMQRHTPTDANDFKLLANYHAPNWVRDAIFYQIFPDRFADGDPTNNVRSNEYSVYGFPTIARKWGELPQKLTGGREFFGGDLQGVIERLPYLEALGITALYLNPIFTAPSNHKYDIADYEKVDPHLGGDTALSALRRALDEHGMHLILDIVPNHCGALHPWFIEAQGNSQAPTADFFTFNRATGDYACWFAVPSLPKLNYQSERLRARMYAGQDAIMRRWMRAPYRIDGWRIDVANMLARQGESQLGHKIGRGIRRAIKEENPDAYLLGENFFDATEHLQGNELDANMNYRGFGYPLLHWLAGYDNAAFGGAAWSVPYPLPTEAMVAQWQTFMAAVPWQIALQQLNLLGSHDTARFFTFLGEDMARARAAVTVLFAFPGVPSVYYGDEIGLAGGNDPDCRRCMPWGPEAWNEEMLEMYQALIRLRRASPALRWGGYQLLHAAGESVAFQREAAEERILVVARRGEDALQMLPVGHGGIADGTRFREFFSKAEETVAQGRLPLTGLPPVGAQLWITATG
ncbi:MAG: maltodextrin glucosidase [Ardenticatenales bacterium]|nr:maltodextrin glucosidase [Ardenticatenales bacterium]